MMKYERQLLGNPTLKSLTPAADNGLELTPTITRLPEATVNPASYSFVVCYKAVLYYPVNHPGN